ncbi:MAG: hypothetical protein VKI83_07570 [Synechococcaceae cyanobacterium]|nr:hypothetical protein [Synechococcaceae cyanobacterium]
MPEQRNWQQNRQLPDYLLAWIRMQFLDLEPVLGLDGEQEGLRRCFGYVAGRDLAWFSDPAFWNLRQEISLRHLFLKDPLHLARTLEEEEGMEVFSFHLRTGAAPRLRCNGTLIDPDTALAGLSAPKKCLAFLAPPDREGLVVKSSPELNDLLLEAQVLHALPERVLAPQPRGVFLAALLPTDGLEEAGLSLLGENQSLESLLPGISLFRHGDYEQLDDGIRAVILEALQQLVYPDRFTTLRQQAERLGQELLASGRFQQAQLDLIGAMLAAVQDETPVASSRCHGDLRPENLQICPLDFSGESYTCGIGFFDWEFSHDDGLGVLDWMSLVMDSAYVDCISFEALLAEVKRRQLSQVSRTALPGCQLPFQQLFTLHLMRYVLDRYPRQITEDTPRRMLCLHDILASEPAPIREFLALRV